MRDFIYYLMDEIEYFARGIKRRFSSKKKLFCVYKKVGTLSSIYNGDEDEKNLAGNIGVCLGEEFKNSKHEISPEEFILTMNYYFFMAQRDPIMFDEEYLDN